MTMIRVVLIVKAKDDKNWIEISSFIQIVRNVVNVLILVGTEISLLLTMFNSSAFYDVASKLQNNKTFILFGFVGRMMTLRHQRRI